MNTKNDRPLPTLLTDEQVKELDFAMLRDKASDGYGQRNQAQAMRLQVADQQQDWSAV